jgi:hyaluronan-mediated motility receptor
VLHCTAYASLRTAQAQDFDAARGDLGAQLDNLKSAYNAAVAELGESKGVGRELLARVSGLEHEVEKKRAENDRLLKDFQDRNQEALDDMLRARQTFEGETKLLRENVTHLEILRNNLERSVSEKEETARTRQEEAAVAREAVVAAEARQADAEKANLRLKANLELRAAEARSLKEEARGVRDRCGEEVRRREGSLERVKADCRELQENVAQVEALRRRELEMVVELRGQLAVTTDAEEQAESAVRSMEAQQRLLQEAEVGFRLSLDRFYSALSLQARVDEFKTALEQWQQKFGEAEDVMQAMEGEKEQLEAERGRLEKQLAELQQMVEPYRDQLEAFELERRALVAQSQVAEGEAQKLAVQNGRLLGHQNHSQKIQHVVKLKQENVGLKTEVRSRYMCVVRTD